MNNYRYTFDKSNKKYTCPKCNKKTYVKYKDILTNELLPDQYGKCDRVNNCQYHLNPYKNGYNNKQIKNSITNNQTQNIKPKIQTYIPWNEYHALNNKNYNDQFSKNLINHYGKIKAKKILDIYNIGNTNIKTCFPYIDQKNRIHGIQTKIYDLHQNTDKSKKYHTGSIKTELNYKYNTQKPEWLQQYNQNEKYFTTMFGTHLLKKYTTASINIFEAPKTVIYYTAENGTPEETNEINLATGNIHGLTKNRYNFKEFNNRKIYLWPDTSKNGETYNYWKKLGEKMEKTLSNTEVYAIDILENITTSEEKNKGIDIADLIIKKLLQ